MILARLMHSGNSLKVDALANIFEAIEFSEEATDCSQEVVLKWFVLSARVFVNVQVI